MGVRFDPLVHPDVVSGHLANSAPAGQRLDEQGEERVELEERLLIPVGEQLGEHPARLLPEHGERILAGDGK